MASADVLVVGAGLAGLYAARLLWRAGLKVMVLEARDRVGGRTLSHRLADGTFVDLGAQWIGPGQKRMYGLAQEFGLAMVASHTQGDTVVEIGERIRRIPRTATPIPFLAQLDALQLSWRLSRIANKLPVSKPWEYLGAKQLDSLSFADWLKANTYSEAALSYWRFIVESGMCASPDEFSALEVAQQLATIGGLGRLETAEQDFLAEGAQAIAQRLADELGDTVHLLAPVQQLEQDDQSVRVTTPRGEFQGRQAILAIPPQLIENIAFDPPLPRQPHWRPQDLVLGQVIKSILVYERAWWREAGLSGSVTAPGGPISAVLDGSNGDGLPGILVALSTGPRAATLSEMDTETRKASILSHIQQWFGEPPPLLHFFSTDWMAEPWSRGGYASRRVLGRWVEQQDALAAPCGRVHFAGTETATQWRSYMEGALQSGERVSQEVIDAFAQNGN